MEKRLRAANVESRSVGNGSPLLHLSRILPRKRSSSGRDGSNKRSWRPRSHIMPDDDVENRHVKLRYFSRRNSGSLENSGSVRANRKHVRPSILDGDRGGAMCLTVPNYDSSNNVERLSTSDQQQPHHSIIC